MDDDAQFPPAIPMGSLLAIRFARGRFPLALFLPLSGSFPDTHVMSFSRFAEFPPAFRATVLLAGSNIFMTFAWYAHLRNLRARPLLIAIAVSWGIALFEYMLQVPANRIGYQTMSLGQLKILQEVITLTVFIPFAVLYMRQPLKTDFLWAGLCLVGAVYFVFRA